MGIMIPGPVSGPARWPCLGARAGASSCDSVAWPRQHCLLLGFTKLCSCVNPVHKGGLDDSRAKNTRGYLDWCGCPKSIYMLWLH